MSAMQNSQTIALQLEKVRDKVPLLYERDDVLLSMIQQRGDVEKVRAAQHAPALQLIPAARPEATTPTAATSAAAPARCTTWRKFADILPVRRGNHQARRVRHQCARKSHRERREARSRQRHETVSQLPRQSNSDRRQRRARHHQLDRSNTFTMAVPTARRSCTWARRSRSTIPRSPRTATSRPASSRMCGRRFLARRRSRWITSPRAPRPAT